MPRSQTEILTRAESLATDLTGSAPPVKKNVLLSVVADFMSDRQPQVSRLRQLLTLLEAGSGGHLLRTENYRDQLLAVIRVIGPVLDEPDYEPQDLKTLFGWTARLLTARDPQRGATEGGHGEKTPTKQPGKSESGKDPVRQPDPPQRLAGLQLAVPPPPHLPSRPAIRQGVRVDVMVIRLAKGYFTVVPVEGEHEIEVRDTGFPWKVGDRRSVKVAKVGPDGRITKVTP